MDAIARVRELEKELVLRNKQIKILKDQIGKDELTGLYKWHSKIAQEIIQDKLLSAGRQGLNAWLCLADVDFLKIINDKLGMDKGDIAIKLVGESINSTLRGLNNTYKYGADEFPFFVALDDDTNLVKIFERIYKKFQFLLNNSTSSTELHQMLSFSCAASKFKVVKSYDHGGLEFEKSAEVFSRVDALLHKQAKNLKGKVSFVVEGQEEPILFAKKYDLSEIIANDSDYAKRYPDS